MANLETASVGADDFTRASAAIRRCVKRLEKDGVDFKIVTDAVFAEAAGRWAAYTGEAEAVKEVAVVWAAIGVAAEIKRGVNGNDQ